MSSRLSPIVLSMLMTVAPAGCDKSQPPNNKSDSASASPTPQPAAPSASSPLAPGEGPHWSLQPAGADFGTVWAGELIKMPFRFSNTGKQPLQILEVKSHCSCSAADDYTREVAPGQAGLLTFVLDTLGKRGPVKETLTAKTNDPTQPEMVMTLVGNVKAIAELEVISDLQASQEPEPEKALQKIKTKAGSFGNIKKDQRLQRVVKIRNTSGAPLKLKVMPLDPPNTPFNAQVEEKVPGEEYLVTITGDPPFKFGSTMATLPFETNVAGQPVYKLGMYAYVANRVELRPRRVVVDPQYPFIKQRRLLFQNFGERPVHITAISKSDERLDVRLDTAPQSDPKQTVILVDLPGKENKDYAPPVYGEVIRIETDDAEFKSFDVYVLPSVNTPVPPPPRPADKPLKLIAVPMGK